MRTKTLQENKSERGLRIGGRKSAQPVKSGVPDDFLQKIAHGDRALFAKALTLVTSTVGGDRAHTRSSVLSLCRKAAEPIPRIVVTGAIGSGKSRLIERLGLFLLLTKKMRPCVLTLDSPSASSGGCLLGNKAAMHELGKYEEVLIRPLAAANSSARCAAMLDHAMTLCAAGPFDALILEAGSDSPARSSLWSLSDCLISVIPAGTEGELAAMRSGMGLDADIHVMTWPPGTRRDKGLVTMRELSEALSLFSGHTPNEKPVVVSIDENDDQAAHDLWEIIDRVRKAGRQSGKNLPRRAAAQEHLLRQHLCARFEEDFFADDKRAAVFASYAKQGGSTLGDQEAILGELMSLYNAKRP